MKRLLYYSLASLGVILLQTLVVRFLVVIDIIPDLLLIWVVYIAIRDGQVAATAAGFLLGLCVDFLSGTDGMIGLAALSKTIAGFTAGYFYNENRTSQILGGSRFIIAVAVASLVHNGLYFAIFLQGTQIGWGGILFRYGFPTTVYTCLVALLPMFVFARKYMS